MTFGVILGTNKLDSNIVEVVDFGYITVYGKNSLTIFSVIEIMQLKFGNVVKLDFTFWD